MELSKDKKKDILVIIIYILLPIIFFGLGVNLFQTAIAPGDALISGYPSKLSGRHFDLWNPYNGSGGISTTGVAQVFYLLDIMRFIPNELGYNLFLLSHYSVAGIFTYLFLRKSVLDRTPSFIAGLIFMFSGFLCAHKGHQSMLTAAVWLPAILYFLSCYFVSQRKKHIIIAGLVYSLVFYADYPAMIMYVGMIVFPYIIFKCTIKNKSSYKEKIMHCIKVMLGVLGVAISVSLPYLLIMLEAMQYSNRTQITYEDFTVCSFNIKYFLTLIFPNFMKDVFPMTEINGYIGLLPIVFAIIAIYLFRKKNKEIYFWSGVVFVGVFLVLGNTTPLYRFMYYMPVYNKFRIPARNWYEVNFGIAILVGYSIHYLKNMSKEACNKISKYTLWITSGIFACSIMILIVGEKIIKYLDQSKVDFSLESLGKAISLMNPYNLCVFGIMIVTLFLIWGLKKFRHEGIYWILVMVVIFGDLFSFGHFHDNSYGDLCKGNEVYEFIKDREEQVEATRTYAFDTGMMELDPMVNIVGGINYINNYGPLQERDYLDFTNFTSNGYNLDKVDLLVKSKVLSMLATKYVVTADPYYKEVLDSALIGNEKSEIIYNSSSEMNLQSIDGTNVAMWQVPIKLENRTNYKVSLKVKGEPSNEKLMIDFYGEQGYDKGAQEVSIDTFSSEYQTYEWVINSGEIPQEEAFFRIFTFGKELKMIKDICIEKVGAGALSLNDSNQANRNLYTKLVDFGDISIYQNNNYLPRARFVTQLEPVVNVAEAKNIAWYDDNFNPKDTALVEGLEELNLDMGQVVEQEYRNDDLTLTVETGERSFLVLADSFYPGWKAYIDGEETRVYRVNGVQRGVLVEGEGSHVIEFKYEPRLIQISFVFSGIVFISLLVYLVIESKKNRIKRDSK